MIFQTKPFFVNGSRWVRADFHLHTKADKEFSYSSEENSFIKEYVAALEENDIRIGVITNHNKFALEEFKALKKAAKKKEILLLPGVELSVKEGSNGVHMLIIFSEDWIANGDDFITPFIDTQFRGRKNYEHENECSSNDITTTLTDLKEYNKDFFVIFAHVEQNSGLWKSLNGGLITQLGKSHDFRSFTLGFQKVRTYDKIDTRGTCRIKVKDWLGGWYPAEVEGSDPKSIADIGKGKECFIKLGDFSFNAVKFSLVEYENRVSKDKLTHTHSYIDRISFDGGILEGKTIHFSPEMNTLIGIRGSGKSSIVEAIRYALDIPFGVKALDTDYKESLIDHVLGSGGKVTIHAIDAHGSNFEIRRINKHQANVYIDGVIQPGISIQETIIRKPIYFGQKDLSATGAGFEKDLVEKFVKENLYESRRLIGQKKEAIADLIDQLTKLSNTSEKRKEYADRKTDAEFKLKFFQEHDVEKKLEKQIEYDTDARRCRKVTSFVDSYLTELNNLVNQYEDDLNNQQFYTSKINEEFFVDFFSTYEELIGSFSTLKSVLSESQNTLKLLKSKTDDFNLIRKNLQEEFAEIERNLSARIQLSGNQSINTNEFRNLKKTVDETSYMLEVLDKNESSSNRLETDLKRELIGLNEMWRDEFQIIQRELDKINGQASLKIVAKWKGNKIEFLNFMKDIFRGSRIRESVLKKVVDKYTDFGSMYEHMPEVKILVGTPSEIFEKYFTDNLTSLLTFQPPNLFRIEYQGKELKHHSLGQRASALILFILNQQDNDVFIIDQPEDDLDNQTIYRDVIKLIRKLKYKTQFIFATHNANFPVLGDAEQVITCAYSNGTIRITSGSIDCPKIQKEIVDIMEGGEEAFEKRRKRYEIWKPKNY